MSDLIHKTAAQLAEMLAAGTTTSVEITQAHLDRIAAVDGDLNAFLHVNAAVSLEAAKASDARRAAGAPTPARSLHACCVLHAVGCTLPAGAGFGPGDEQGAGNAERGA